MHEFMKRRNRHFMKLISLLNFQEYGTNTFFEREELRLSKFEEESTVAKLRTRAIRYTCSYSPGAGITNNFFF